MNRQELFARLAAGHAARISVVTPNTRLAQALVQDFDSFQTKKNISAWEAPDILPFSAFIERTWDEALYADLAHSDAAELPMLLTPAQEEQLWRQAIERADFLAPDEAAAQCRAAWRLAHAWRIARGAGNEDAQAFNGWCRRYEELARGSVDAARLPDLVSSLLGERTLKKPKLLVAYAFDILPAQTEAFFAACRDSGIEVESCAPEALDGTVQRTAYPSARHELEAAAQWARARLEAAGDAQPAPRIGVVVPQLERRRREVVRVFSRVMQPAFNLPGAAKAPQPFNVSLGLPLAEYPLVAAGLDLLELSIKEVEFARVSSLLRSPFLSGAEDEMALRARLDARMRRDMPPSLSLAKLIALVERCPMLRAALEKVFAVQKPESQSPQDWARHFSALLDAAGFPGARTLDSEEFQARAKWHEVLGDFARLERVAKRLDAQKALSILRRLCRDTLFQPESGDAPVQVLGVLESAGARFDHLWVSGLTDEAWPLAAAPNPFLPVALQKQAGIPEASAEGSAALDKRITAGWRSAALEVVFSHAEKDADRDLSPSPLILDVPIAPLALPAAPRYRDVIFAARRIDAAEDCKAPALTEKKVRGGTRVLADHAACAFRAFAHWRLDAKRLDAPSEGLDAAKRGTLVHALMKHLFSHLKGSSDLQGEVAPAISRAAAAAVQELELEGRFAELERTRLERLARDWLEVEKARKPFEVIAVEKEIAFRVAGIDFSGRIDRMDRTAEGNVLIDYKTSRNPTPKHWEPPRPDDPQLPIYAGALKEDIAALAFAKLRPGQLRYMGFSRTKDLVPKVAPAKNWDALLDSWRREAESLGASYASGDARVDPKRELTTCRNCDLHTLCRVYEKLNPLKESEEGE